MKDNVGTFKAVSNEYTQESKNKDILVGYNKLPESKKRGYEKLCVLQKKEFDKEFYNYLIQKNLLDEITAAKYEFSHNPKVRVAPGAPYRAKRVEPEEIESEPEEMPPTQKRKGASYDSDEDLFPKKFNKRPREEPYERPREEYDDEEEYDEGESEDIQFESDEEIQEKPKKKPRKQLSLVDIQSEGDMGSDEEGYEEEDPTKCPDLQDFLASEDEEEEVCLFLTGWLVWLANLLGKLTFLACPVFDCHLDQR